MYNEKGNEKMNASRLITKFIGVTIAFAMLIPMGVGQEEASEMPDYLLISAGSSELEVVRSSEITIAKDYGSFLLTTMSPGMMNELRNAGYEIQNVDREIQFPTFCFDTNEGSPDLPQDLTAPESDYKIVQFIGPIAEDWKEEIVEQGVQLLQSVNNHAFLVKMDNSQNNRIQSLPFISWIGNYEPAYKIRSEIGTSGMVSLTVSVFKTEDLDSTVDRLESLGADVRWTTPMDDWDSTAVIEIDAGLVDDIVRLPQVSGVATWTQAQTLNDQAVGVTQANEAWYEDTSGIIVPPTTSYKYSDYPGGVTNTWGGLTGFDQVVGVLDTGFDLGVDDSGHYDYFLGPLGDRVLRVQRSATSPGPTADDGENGGHGTHVAGIIGGNGWCAEEEYSIDNNDHTYGGDHVFAGHAPESLLSFDACREAGDGIGLYPAIPLAWDRQYADGARIHTNSWGSSPGYVRAQIADQFMWDNRESLLLFPAGHDGPNYNTVSDPASAKNDLTVGASGNNRPAYKHASDQNLIVPFSSRGPFTGRYEPDVVAPGEHIASLHAVDYVEDPSDYDWDANIYNDPECGEDLKIDQYPPGGSAIEMNYDYAMMSGTSMASAAVAGNTALVRQYYTQVDEIIPSGMLMKATMIHGTQDLGFGFPSNDQGWGRINVKNSLFPEGATTWQYSDNNTGITTGQTWDAETDGGMNNLYIQSDRVPLKVTLTWLDYPGGGGALLNDMHLRVTSPTGTIYRGNNFVGTGSVPGGSFDTANTVEKVIIQTPEVNEVVPWTIEVIGQDLPDGPIPFALIVSGDFGPEEEYRVEMSPISLMRFNCVAGGSTTFNFNLLNFGTNSDTISLSEIDLPIGVSILYSTGSSVGLSSNRDRDVTALILVNGAVIPQAYTFSLKGTSINDPQAPPSSDRIELTMGVSAFATAPLIRCTDSMMSEKSPTILTFNNGTEDNIWVTYLKYDAQGPHLYVRWSTDDGDSWTEKQINMINEAPEDPRILRLPADSPDAPNRIFIYWHGQDPAAPDPDYSSWVRCAYADPPLYDTWTLRQIGLTDFGHGTHNNHRRLTATVHHPGQPSEEIIMVIETIGVPSSTYTRIFDAYSSDGGNTWSVPAQVNQNPGASNLFPDIDTTELGEAFLVWYISDGGGTGRDVHWSEYQGSGTWNSTNFPMINALSTGEQDPFPMIWSAPEGANSNRLYAASFRCTPDPPDPPFSLYSTYTDDPTDVTPVWTAAKGSYSLDASQSDYPSGRPLYEGNRADDGYSWITFSEETNIYGTPQIHSAYSNDGFNTWTSYKVTADSIGKHHPTSDALGNNIYTAFSANYVPGNTDIWIAKYGIIQGQIQIDPDLVTDTDGPLVRNIGATPNPTSGNPTITITATVDDTITGYHPISQAQYQIDGAGWNPMTAMDGIFNVAMEGVISIGVDVTGLSLGDHTLEIQGRDDQNNWGTIDSITLTVSPNEPPLFLGVNSVVNPGLGDSLDVFWDPADDPNMPITYRVMGWDHFPSSMEISVATNASLGPDIWEGTALSYRDSGLEQGQTYYYVVRAQDAAGYFEWNQVVKNGTSTIIWWLQAQDSSIGGYKRMNHDPLVTPSTANSPNMDSIGDFLVDTKWLTDAGEFATGVDLEGTWEFNVYGYTTDDNLVEGYLYAIVYKEGSGTLFTTTNDDENVGAFTSTHQFTWTYDVPAGTLLASSDRVFVEFYVDVTQPYSGTGTYNYLTGAGVDKFAWNYIVDTMPPEGNTVSVAECSDYSLIEASDDTRWDSTAPFLDETFVWSNITVNEDSSIVSEIQLTFEGQVDYTAGGFFEIWAYDYSSGTWIQIGAEEPCVVDTEVTFSRSITSGCSDFIDPGTGILTWGCYNDLGGSNFASSTVKTDYLEVQITATIPYFVLEYDDGATPSNVVPVTIPAGLGIYNITLTDPGGPWPAWRFVSFPISASGNAASVFDDAAWGDGGTTWDSIFWYDPSDSLNHWRSYSTYKPPTLNDLPNVDNTMGFWIHITSNNGDQLLSVGSGNIQVTAISLNIGWNMVGYPTLNNSVTVSDAFWGTGADRIEIFDPAEPYNIKEVGPTYTMKPGEAYWIRVSIDNTWTVDW